MALRIHTLTFVLAAAVTAACATEQEEDAGSGASAASGAAEGAVVIVDDPSVLARLEDPAAGGRLGFAAMMGVSGAPAGLNDPGYATSPFSVVRRQVHADVKATQIAWLKHQKIIAESDSISQIDEKIAVQNSIGVGVRYAYRLFDANWLVAERARFELIAVVNRMDLKDSLEGETAGSPTCGRIRLVYRLGYRGVSYSGKLLTAPITDLESRLPMTLNIDLHVPDDGKGCETHASRWFSSNGTADAAFVERAIDRHRNIASIEVNVQSTRQPASIRYNMGGHAEYLLRRFEKASDGTWGAATLQMSPDVAAIKSDPAKIDALKGWVAQNLPKIDSGDAALPVELRARSAVAAQPRGLARLHNRPFSQLLGASSGIPDPSLTSLAVAKNNAQLVRRLDQMSCEGCHATRSIVGFHLIGTDPEDGTINGNQMAVGRSPFLAASLQYRAEYLAYLAKRPGAAPPAGGVHPIPERTGGNGQHCDLGKTQPSPFAGWDCPENFECKDLDSEEVGTCVAKMRGAGDPCEKSAFKPQRRESMFSDDVDIAQNRCGYPCAKSAAQFSEEYYCSQYQCESSQFGYPNGMCYAKKAIPSRTGTTESSGTCTEALAGKTYEDLAICSRLTAFQNCKDSNGDFIGCTTRVPAGPVDYTWLRLCDADNPCRDGYACVREPLGKETLAASWPEGSALKKARSDQGACKPAYFVLQGQVDGHPIAATRGAGGGGTLGTW